MTVAAKPIYFIGSAVLLLTLVAATFFSQPLFYFIPAIAVGCFLGLQFPRGVFYTLLFSIPWSVEWLFANGAGTDLPDEPLMLFMAFIAIALFIQQGRFFNKQLHFSPLLFLLLIGFAWTCLTVITSTNVVVSAKYLLAKGWYLLAFVGATLLLLQKQKHIYTAALVLCLSMLLVTALALVRHLAADFRFIAINNAVAPFFRNHVNYSALLVFMVPLLLAFYQLRQKVWQRNLLFLSFAITLAALYFSYARGAWLALVTGLAAYWLIKQKWLFKTFVIAIAVVAAGVFWLQQNDRYLQFAPQHDITIFHEDFSEHLVATYQGSDVSTAERFYRWVAGARMSADKWGTGFGPTTFYQNYQSYAVPTFRTWVSDNPEHSTVHNYFLLLLIEQGAPGLLFFLLLVGAMFWYAQTIYLRTADRFWKATAAAIGAILCMQCTVNFLSDLIETDKVGSVFYLCLAVLVIADRRTREEAISTKARSNET